MNREEVVALNREEALAAFVAFTPQKGNRERYKEAVGLSPEVLDQITAADMPVDVPVEIRIWHDEPYPTCEIPWHGWLVLGADGSFWSIIRYDYFPGLWWKPLGVTYYFEILHTIIQIRMRTMKDLIIDKCDIHENDYVLLQYRFPVGGANLKEALDRAKPIRKDLEAPAEQVLDDVTRALERSVDKVFGGQGAQVSVLLALVESAESSSQKGAALESLMAALFEQVPGFVVCGRDVRTKTEEIDLVLLNSSSDPVYSKDGPLVLVECKNWTSKPGRPDFSLLEGRIRNRHNRCTLAFFVSWSGYRETAWRETIRTSRENYAIVCLKGDDIRRAALAGNFPDFLRQATIQALTM